MLHEPLQEECYEYSHPQTGLCFQLLPEMVEDSELAAEYMRNGEEVDQGVDGTMAVQVVAYRPVALGRAKLPPHLQVRCREV